MGHYLTALTNELRALEVSTVYTVEAPDLLHSHVRVPNNDVSTVSRQPAAQGTKGGTLGRNFVVRPRSSRTVASVGEPGMSVKTSSLVASLALLALPALAQPTPPQSPVSRRPWDPRARNRAPIKPAQQRASTMCRAFRESREIRVDRRQADPDRRSCVSAVGAGRRSASNSRIVMTGVVPESAWHAASALRSSAQHRGATATC
jgi:hypothetical protein